MGARDLKFLENVHLPPRVTWYVSPVTCPIFIFCCPEQLYKSSCLSVCPSEHPCANLPVDTSPQWLPSPPRCHQCPPGQRPPGISSELVHPWGPGDIRLAECIKHPAWIRKQYTDLQPHITQGIVLQSLVINKDTLATRIWRLCMTLLSTAPASCCTASSTVIAMAARKAVSEIYREFS